MSSDSRPQEGQSVENEPALLVGEDYAVFPNQRLPALDSPCGEAYLAHDLRVPSEPRYALRCRRDLQPRLEVVRGIAKGDELPFACPLAWAAVAWPDDGREHYVVVLRRPDGPRLVAPGETALPKLREDFLKRGVVPQLVAVLSELHARQVGHRAIRADNIFFADESRSSIVVGECVSEPPGLSQPVIYEPIAPGMALPFARATGGPSDDIYAVGVLLVMLLNGGDPCAGMSDEEIIQSKILHGTFGTLVRKARIPLSIMEPLRGMLSDDPGKRWTADDLDLWLVGRHRTPKSHTLAHKAPRPFEFRGEEYWHLQTLAHAMAKHWDEAVVPVADGSVLAWIKRCYGNDVARGEFVELIEQLLAPTRRGVSTEDTQLAGLLMAFHPQAPIRYRNLSVQPEALGRALAFGGDKGALKEDFLAVIESGLALTWLHCQDSMRPEFVPFSRAIETVRDLLDRSGWGFGLERCLYELNEAIPCRSPLLDRFLISKIDQLLPALSRIAEEEPQDLQPVDRHIAAFCAAQIKEIPRHALLELSEDPDSPEHRLGILRLLANVQQATGGGSRALGRWVLRSLSPVITEFHHRPYRQKLAEQLQKLAEQGALTHMLALLDNEDTRRRDRQGFELARKHYDHAVREVAWLRSGGLTSDKHVTRGSQQAALLISSVISGCTLLALTLIYVG